MLLVNIHFCLFCLRDIFILLERRSYRERVGETESSSHSFIPQMANSQSWDALKTGVSHAGTVAQVPCFAGIPTH